MVHIFASTIMPICSSTVHSFSLRRIRLFTEFDFTVDLGRHASTDAAKYHIRHNIDNVCQGIVSFTFGAHCHTRQAHGKNHQAIAAPNQTNVVLIQTQTIFLSNDVGSRTSGGARTQKCLQTHARHRARLFAHASRLQAATSTKISLTALVVGPTGTWIDMVQCLVAHVDLSRTETRHASQPTAGFSAGSLTEINIKLAMVVGDRGVGPSIFSIQLMLREWFVGKAKEAHCGFESNGRSSAL
jgi:hypothetical protein